MTLMRPVTSAVLGALSLLGSGLVIAVELTSTESAVTTDVVNSVDKSYTPVLVQLAAPTRQP